jgi:hypothetical protein
MSVATQTIMKHVRKIKGLASSQKPNNRSTLDLTLPVDNAAGQPIQSPPLVYCSTKWSSHSSLDLTLIESEPNEPIQTSPTPYLTKRFNHSTLDLTLTSDNNTPTEPTRGPSIYRPADPIRPREPEDDWEKVHRFDHLIEDSRDSKPIQGPGTPIHNKCETGSIQHLHPPTPAYEDPPMALRRAREHFRSTISKYTRILEPGEPIPWDRKFTYLVCGEQSAQWWKAEQCGLEPPIVPLTAASTRITFENVDEWE